MSEQIAHVVDLFATKAAGTPEHPAILCGDKQISYRELDDRTNAVANHLIEHHDVAQDALVALVFDRGDSLLTAILGVLKSGGAYVPIEADQPADRIGFLLEDAATTVVLTDSANCERVRQILTKLGRMSVQVVEVGDDVTTDLASTRGTRTSSVEVSVDDLAYVIYTSGTTGQPNGVLIEHGAVANYVDNVARHLGLCGDDVVDFSTSIGFDLTVTTSLAALAIGATVAVYTDPVQQLHRYVEHLIERQVSFLKLTPSYFSLIAGSIKETNVATVVLGGEKLTKDVLRNTTSRRDQVVKIFDEYGPTEATVGACWAQVFPEVPASLHIGRCYDRCTAHILDSDLQEVGVGEPGELYLSGVGLARGYLNRPRTTDERFVSAPTKLIEAMNHGAPHRENQPSRLYKTGDLAQRREDGNLEYLGRIDDQIKLNGYRVELGEIEARLMEHGDVAHVAVAANVGSLRTLVAYVVAGDFGCSQDELSLYLESRLPEYMCPGAYVFLEALPLTINGKLDRVALPIPRVGGGHVEPRNDLERHMCRLWASFLPVEADDLGINDEFLVVGGDSIIGIQILNAVRQELGVDISVRDFFIHGTVQKLCDRIALASVVGATEKFVPAEVGRLSGAVGLLPIQRWFFDTEHPVPTHWNQAFVIKTPPLDVDKLGAAARSLNHYHGAFHLRFRRDDEGRLRQSYETSPPPELRTLDVAMLPGIEGSQEFNESFSRCLTSWQSEFDLEVGPVHSVGYVHGFEDGSARIHVAAHHLVIDAVSWRIIAADLEDLYNASELPPLGNSYRQWTDAISQYGELQPEEQQYWAASRTRLESTATLLALVEDEATVSCSSFRLTRQQTEKLLREANPAYNTQVNDLLLTAFALALEQLTGHRAHDIVLEGHGREEVDVPLDVSRTVGWFTTMFPVRLRLEEKIAKSVVAVKETLRSVPNKGIGYGAYNGYDIAALPRINFNYLGQFQQVGTQAVQIGDRWQLTGEDAGLQVHEDNRDFNVITINGQVIDGVLGFQFVSKFSHRVTANLASWFHDALIDVIDETTLAGRTHLTPSDIDHVVSADVLDLLQAEGELDAVLRANSLQQGFIAHAVTQVPDDRAYVVQAQWRYDTAIDSGRLRRAWAQAQRTFPSLRLRFDWQDELVQVVDKDQPLEFEVLDATSFVGTDQQVEIDRITRTDRARGFDLRTGPLFRVFLIERGPEQSTCLLTIHHAVLDGWSQTTLLDFVHKCYLTDSDSERPPELAYLRTQRYLQDHYDDDLGFWLNELDSYDDRLSLEGLVKADARRAGHAIAEHRRVRDEVSVSFQLEGERYQAVREFARRHGVTVNAVVLYLWHKTLWLFGDGDQTATGVVVSGRSLPIDGIEASVGLFINTLPSIVIHPTDEQLAESMRYMQRSIGDLNDRCCVDLASLSAGRGRLFDTLFIYENWPEVNGEDWSTKLKVESEAQTERLDYPLAAVIRETEANLTVDLTYADEIIDGACVDEMQRVLHHLLGQVVDGTGPDWSDLRFVASNVEPAAQERHQGDNDRDKAVFPELFAEQVRRVPSAIAVRCGELSLTYEELDARANRLANHLVRDHELTSEEPVVVCTKRSIDVFVAMLGVMKAGGAYVPVDPNYPATRIQYVIEDTGARIVITDCASQLPELAVGNPPTVLDLHAVSMRELLSSAQETLSDVALTTSNLAYVLYTSGTTGKPKGVMIEHGSFTHLIGVVHEQLFNGRLGLNTFSVTNFVFDIFGLEYGLPLLTGGTIELGRDLPTVLSCRSLDFFQTTPSVLELLLDRMVDVEDTLLLCGGEPLSETLLDRAHSRSMDVVNVYGPTETTIWSTFRSYPHSAPEQSPWIDLGESFFGEHVEILDANLQQVPVGASGELYIGGAGLARGYLGMSELTAERFVRNPRQPETVLYKTGDLVRRHMNGELEFLGRDDFQVKIRGHRIELAEVEGAIAAVPGVSQCVVAATANLVGYYVAGAAVNQEHLTAHLYRTLPSYMVPTTLIELESMPLTPSGKLDRNALPSPDQARGARIVAPRTQVERELRSVWARCLDSDEKTIGIDDDFFWLGGDSIDAIRVCAELYRLLEVDVDVSTMHSHRTVRQLAEALWTVESGWGEIKAVADLTKPQPLSFAQERLWFVDRLSHGAGAYNVPLVLEIAERVDMRILHDTFIEITRRHPVLSSVVREAPSGLLQELQSPTARKSPLDLQITQLPSSREVDAALRSDAAMDFDLANDPPFWAHVYQADDTGRKILSIVVHHIAFDGWSIDILLRDLDALYRTLAAGATGSSSHEPLEELTINYHDYARWERDVLTPDRIAESLNFWKRRLDGFETLAMPNDHPRPDLPDTRGANHRFQVCAETSTELRDLARELHVSVFSVLLSAFYITIRAFSFQDDLVVGTPVVNRNQKQLENLIGVFVNTIPLRQRVDTSLLVADFIRSVGRTGGETFRHQHVPFEKLVETLGLAHDPSRHPVFQVLFDVQSFGHGDDDEHSLLKLVGKAWEFSDVAKHDLSIFIDDSAGGLDVFVNYATALFDATTVASVADTYAEVLRQFARLARTGPDRWQETVADLCLVGDEQRQQVLEHAAGPLFGPESQDTIVGAFEQQVLSMGSSDALISGGLRLSYDDLDLRANQMAHFLRSKCGVEVGMPVLLCVDRGVDMIVAILAVLKAGGVYIPVEPSYPDQRVSFILEDCDASVVLTQHTYRSRLSRLAGAATTNEASPAPIVLAVDARAFKAQLDIEPVASPVSGATCKSGAYVIYTSGSTGKPKGVSEVHENVVRLFEATNRVVGIETSDVWVMFHSYVFDFSVWEIWGALLHGGTLIVPSHEEVRDPEVMYDLCCDHRVSILNQTPAALSSFMDVALAKSETTSDLESLRCVFIGGEQWDVNQLSSWVDRFGFKHPLLVHVYGPTETTVFATMQPFTETVGGIDSSLGPVLPNMTAYVVDPELRLLPDGAIGELCIGGTGLALGYLNRPELTSTAFLPNPFQTDADRRDTTNSAAGRNARIYRSGDLVRRNGPALTFVGRNDDQVKIQGHRIELGEIDMAVAGFAGVSRCVTIVKTDAATRYLAVYYVATRRIDEAALREHLAAMLPVYMLPSVLISLDNLPLTVSGKIDRAALPDPGTAGEAVFVEPRTATERSVRQIVAALLDLAEDTVSVDADFFTLGGSSLLSIRLLAQLNREFSAGIDVRTLFTSPSIAGLAAEIDDGTVREEPIPLHRPVDPMLQSLSFSQERLWFVDQYEGGTSAYNIGLNYALAPTVRLDALIQSLQEIYVRHEVLRTVIDYGHAGGHQRVIDADEMPLNVVIRSVDTETELKASLAKDLEQVIDLAMENPIRASVYDCDGSLFLGLVIHHIAFDGWSVEVLVGELEQLYRTYSVDPTAASPLEPLQVQYRDYAAWQRTRLSDDVASEAVAYWKERLQGVEPLNLPTDRPRPQTTSYLGAEIPFEIDAAISAQLRDVAAELNVSLFSVLMSAYFIMLGGYSYQDDMIVGVPVADRTHSQVGGMIGCFLNTLPVDLHIAGDGGLVELIRSVAERIAAGRQHQDLPFEYLVAELDLAVDQSRHPVFQVTFDVNSFVSSHFDPQAAANDSILRFYRPEQGSSFLAKFDLSVYVDDSRDQLHGTFTYATSLFNRASIEELIATYSLLLTQIGELAGTGGESQLRVSELNLLSEKRLERVLTSWGEGPERVPGRHTVLDLFKEQVDQVPHKSAVVFGETTLSYQQLDSRSDRLAAMLIDQGVMAEDLVLLNLRRSELIVVAILAVWKAGAAYVPVDPDFPDARLSYILDDTHARAVLCNEAMSDRWAQISDSRPVPILALDDENCQHELSKPRPAFVGPRPHEEHLAYVIYTSGTSGEAKGVMIQHNSLTNLHADQTSRYGIGQDGCNEVILQISNFVFDASVEQLALALPNGHTLLLVPERLWMEPKEFNEYLSQHRVTHVSATPTFLREFEIGPLASLRRYVVGGEELDRACYRLLIGQNNVDVFNQYGPTEITVTAVGHRVVEDDLSIGRPMANVKAVVLTSDGVLAPVGAVGELYIGGVGVARGYLNKPELTETSFVPNRYQSQVDRNDTRFGSDGRFARLYRTGDLVRWSDDGLLSYLGRADQQVKIRGHRVELGEITDVLADQQAITSAIVIVTEPPNERLAAYYTSDADLDEAEILRSLRARLPEYMVPAFITKVSSLPLTAHGKIDTDSLPTPTLAARPKSTAALDPVELEIRACWADVLDLDPNDLTADDDFFEVGGSSILAIQLVTRLASTQWPKLTISQVFTHRSIRTQRLVLTTASAQDLVPLNTGGEQPRLFMIHPAHSGSEVYASLATRLEGCFACIGIDSYNLAHDTKLSRIEELAANYASQIESAIPAGDPAPVRLFGWSLGGHLALEVAVVLESRGHRDIRICAADTVLPDPMLVQLSESMSIEQQRDNYRARLVQDGLDPTYLSSVLSNFHSDVVLSKQLLSHRLECTDVTLIKALSVENPRTVDPATAAVHEHVLDLDYNNIDHYVDAGRLRRVDLTDAHHYNVLDHEDEIAETLNASLDREDSPAT